MDIANVRFDSQGLVPAVVQDTAGRVLMLAYMNEESLRRTLSSGETWFFSRSRKELWHKGATSGNTQTVAAVTADCDQDALLVTVNQTGSGACHEGDYSCFHHPVEEFGPRPAGPDVLTEVHRVIEDRRTHRREGSYTNYLLDKGADKILKKVGEETAEVIIGAKNDDEAELVYEISDLLYHLLVLLVDRNIDPQKVWQELSSRR